MIHPLESESYRRNEEGSWSPGQEAQSSHVVEVMNSTQNTGFCLYDVRDIKYLNIILFQTSLYHLFLKNKYISIMIIK